MGGSQLIPDEVAVFNESKGIKKMQIEKLNV